MKADRPSSTAIVIAASTILLASEKHDPDPVAPGAAELCGLFLSEIAAGRWLTASARDPRTRRFWRWVERNTLPGIIHHYWRRKRWIEARCRRAIAEGHERVVVIGAGFDTLGVRLAREFGKIEIIEMDHPATQAAKRSALGRGGMEAPVNLRFTAADLTADDNRLPAADEKATVYILEGVLMYLPEQTVAGLLKAIRDGARGRTLVIFSFMTRWPDRSCGFRPHSRLVEHWLAWSKEPFTWALAPERMTDFLTNHGFRLVEMALPREFSNDPRNEEIPLEGENLVVCEPVTR
jgi:methyltransferase (TIGR00027 family)